MSEVTAPIPDDLREHYDVCGKYQSAHLILCRQLIERIAALAQRAELAESRVKELSKPVTNEEGKDAGLFDDGMTDGQLRSWMSKVNTQMLELILTTRPLDKPAWYVRLMTEEVQRRRLEVKE